MSKTMSLVRFLGAILVLFIWFGVLISYSYASDADNGKEIQEFVRSLLRNIHEKNLDGILEAVPEIGLVDGNTAFSKDEIIRDIHDTNSYLYKHLFGEISEKEIDICLNKLNGIYLVSPYTFYERYGEEYEIGISPTGNSNIYFSVRITGKETEKTKPCEFQLWYLGIQKIDTKYYLRRYFFY